MKPLNELTRVLLIAIFLGAFTNVNSQDTTSVQTFTFGDITKRRDVFEFPDSTNEWRKILMYKTLKCDNATTQDQFPCGEWDYLTYTFVYDHTGEIDSNESSHPLRLSGGLDLDTSYSHGTEMIDLYQRVETSVQTDSFNLSNYTALQASSLTNSTEDFLPAASNSSRYQMLWSSSTWTLPSDTLDRIGFPFNGLGSQLTDLTIRMKQSSLSIIDEFQEGGFTTVYAKNTTFDSSNLVGGYYYIDLIEPFAFDSSSGVLVDVSFTNYSTGTSYDSPYSIAQDSNTVYSHGNDAYVEFDNANRYEIPLSEIDFEDEITISFWAYGDENVLPVNTSAFEASDINENRVLNAHLPWSNGTVYWDAGEGSGYDRINKASSVSVYASKWTHWAFTKNTNDGTMKIYLDGNLWHSGTDKNRSIGLIKKIIIGTNRNAANAWPGKMDEFRIWKKELSSANIQEWLYKDLTSSHPDYADLVVYLKFDDGYPVQNEITGGPAVYSHGSPQLRSYRGKDLFKNQHRTTIAPNLSLLLSNGFVSTTSTTDTVMDTVAQAPYSIVDYSVVGNMVLPTSASYPSRVESSYVYDPNGVAIDSTSYSSTQTWINSDLTFYYPPFDVIDRYEIGRFITPYGINLSLGPNGFTWVYDVTDYAHLLIDSVDLSSGNQQELIDLRFEFIEGTPPADIVAFDRPWGQSRSYRYNQMDDDIVLDPMTVDVHPDAAFHSVITRLTGHGHNSNTGSYPHCCEWWDNTHYLYVDGTKSAEWEIWQEHDCGANPVFPQGGTWPGAREGWCPGDLVKDNKFNITDQVSGTDFELDYRIDPVPSQNQGMGNGNYVHALHSLQYADPHYELDAEIYDVIRPNNRQYYSRLNPVCSAPTVIIRNNGSAPITRLKIQYQVVGGNVWEYQWFGYLEFLGTEEVVLPFENGAFYAGDGSNQFIATVSSPNDLPDEYAANDSYTTEFELPELTNGKIILQFKTNNYKNENNLKVYDANENVIFSRIGSQLVANTTYWDTLDLDSGCYRLEVTDANDDGLSYWANPNQGSGFLRLWTQTGAILENFESEFGHKIDYAFTVDSLSYEGYEPTGLEEVVTELGSMKVYPNPNDGSFYLEMLNFNGSHELEIRNLTGQIVHSEKLNIKSGYARRYNLNLPVGVYTISLQSDSGASSQKMVVGQ